MKRLLVVAACLYFFLAPLTYHPDNKLVLYWSGLEQGAVWNIWTYGAKNFGSASQYNYPPVHYYLDKLQYFIAKPIAGAGFDNWLRSQNSLDAFEPKLSRFSLAIKTPLILATLLTALFIYLLAKQKKLTETQSLWAAGLWLFNPITLYSIPIMGQNDVLALLFFLAGWFTIARSHRWALILFGAAASVKLFPLVWLLFVLAVEKKLSIKERVGIFVGSIGTFLLTLLPFIHIPVFRAAVLGSDMNQRFTTAALELGYSDMVYVIPVLLMLLVYAVIKNYHTEHPFSLQVLSLVTVSLVLLGFSHFHVQWYTWLLPFWSLWMVLSSSKEQFWMRLSGSFVVLCSWFGVVVLFADKALTTGIFLPLAPHLVTAPIIRDALIMAGVDALHLNNLAHTALAGMALVAVISVFTTVKKTSAQTLQMHTSPIPEMFTQYSAKAIVVTTSIFLLVCVVLTTMVLHFIPVPRASRAPQNVKFFATSLPHQQSFTAPYNGLYYMELYLKNPGLVDRNDFSVTVAKKTGELVAAQGFNGYNIGDPSTIRFNIPHEEFSKQQEYTVTLKLSDDEQTTAVTLGFDEHTNGLAIQTFYRAPRKPFLILTDVFTALKNVLAESGIPTLVVCLIVCLSIYKGSLPINWILSLRK